ncbi:ABC-type transport system permease protein (probable substrate phosphate) [Salinarchaeum sp. Harcht-Bsk1]|uniref:phosphate ABC transporter permease subunit PstC n=1 Tax=Salinarchaeum sp. Harcht-Bsk1 TaxID=1333523 RepID=UPI0003423FC1|nr:phosphate ABC transporter permease subunit PstC [Salinarchaeum sp. Harcht-Bsk1]AGN00277.1 ABC-type transport system permease protein (probable substrate phosphate) [Salinarchaeum sp. Harcht-Bsk1]
MSTESDVPDLTRDDPLTDLTESGWAAFFVACAAVTLVTTLSIAAMLLYRSGQFFTEYSVSEFLTGTTFRAANEVFGIVPLVIATLSVTVVAGFIALPVGTLTAVYLSEYASTRSRAVLKPMLEILAGVPTIVYGIFALIYITPALQVVFPSLPTFNVLSASLMIGVMTIPMVSSISEDAMSAVPDDLRQAGYGLGATKFEVSTGIVVPASMSGIASSYILAVSRAIGETMILAVATGTLANMPEVREAAGVLPYIHPADVLMEPGMTITTAMIHSRGGELTGGSIAYDALFALGLTLFVVTLVLNVVSDVIAERYREEY